MAKIKKIILTFNNLLKHQIIVINNHLTPYEDVIFLNKSIGAKNQALIIYQNNINILYGVLKQMDSYL